ncbi:hypothetical protein ACQJBY_032041 [Aegilops geniculata]
MPRRSQSSAPIDLDEEDECKTKRSRASIRPAPKVPGSSNRIASSRRDKENQDKLDTRIFDLYMENLWKRTDEDQKNACAYLDPLWFNSYVNGDKEQKSRILRWTKKLKIFSRKYVFVPIVRDIGTSLSYATLTRQTAQMQKKDRECCCWIHLTQQIRRDSFVVFMKSKSGKKVCTSLKKSVLSFLRCHSKLGRNVVYMFSTSSTVFFKTENGQKFFRIKHWKKISASCLMMARLIQRN